MAGEAKEFTMYYIYLWSSPKYRLVKGEAYVSQIDAVNRADDLRIINGLRHSADSQILFFDDIRKVVKSFPANLRP